MTASERGDRAGAPREAAGLRARALAALRFHPREVVALAVLGALVVAGASIAYARARPSAGPSMAPVIEPTPSAEPAREIVVHVVGAVRTPGVYTFQAGARVLDAVRAAGGFSKGADPSLINLARLLVDGEQVVVPKRGEAPQPVAQGAGSAASAAGRGGKLNINLAGERELESLPGIGPVLAQRIVEYRTQHGPFRTVRDLLKVPGIGDKKFASLEPYVTV